MFNLNNSLMLKIDTIVKDVDKTLNFSIDSPNTNYFDKMNGINNIAGSANNILNGSYDSGSSSNTDLISSIYGGADSILGSGSGGSGSNTDLISSIYGGANSILGSGNLGSSGFNALSNQLNQTSGSNGNSTGLGLIDNIANTGLSFLS